MPTPRPIIARLTLARHDSGPAGIGTSAAQPRPGLSDLYRAHAAFVARLAFRLLGRDNEVDDVVHDVFFDLMRQLSSLENLDDLRGWLTTVTVRAARKRLRRDRLRQWVGLDRHVEYEALVAQDAPQEERIFLVALYRALEQLPVNQRLAWSLRYLQEESLEEVAAQCEVSLATIKRRILAAQNHLREEMGTWTNP